MKKPPECSSGGFSHYTINCHWKNLIVFQHQIPERLVRVMVMMVAKLNECHLFEPFSNVGYTLN